MYKILRVGDPHVTVTNLAESRELMKFVIKNAKERNCRHVELLGDLFHTHAVVRSEILNFWTEIFGLFAAAEMPVKCLVGNHDQIGDRERENVHALIPFKNFPYVTVIDIPMVPGPSCIAYLPYMADKDKFVEAANRLFDFEETTVLVCHQTFQGSTFENGFYAEDGIDLSLLKHKQIISGHIHKMQKIGKCFYPGTAKWDKATDAGQDKGIWFFEHAENGDIITEEFITTKDIVTPIYRYVIKEGEPEPDISATARVAIELHGSSAWIVTMKKKYKNKASIRAIPIDRKTVKMDSSKLLSIEDFARNSFNPIEGVSRDDVVTYIRSLDAAAN
jgi:DNA repair exonuclease SbcCD nuclease subunit